MRITKKQLRTVILEELQRALLWEAKGQHEDVDETAQAPLENPIQPTKRTVRTTGTIQTPGTRARTASSTNESIRRTIREFTVATPSLEELDEVRKVLLDNRRAASTSEQYKVARHIEDAIFELEKAISQLSSNQRMQG